MAAAIACGGSEGEDLSEGLEFVFDDEEPAETVITDPSGPISVFARLTEDEWRYGRVSYAYDVSHMVGELESSRRTMVRLLERGQEHGGNLDWVTEVHDEHRVSEELRIRAYNYALPEELLEDYADFHAVFLEAVQLYARGSDRMLQAAIVAGPTGRNALDMAPVDRAEFYSLLSEGVFFLADAELLVGRSRDDLKEITKHLRVR